MQRARVKIPGTCLPLCLLHIEILTSFGPDDSQSPTTSCVAADRRNLWTVVLTSQDIALRVLTPAVTLALSFSSTSPPARVTPHIEQLLHISVVGTYYNSLDITQHGELPKNRKDWRG